MSASSARPDDMERTEFPFDATAAGQARTRVRQLLDRWRLPEYADDVTLMVSEIVGNAVRYGRPKIWMTLSRLGRTVTVAVHDEEPGAPDATATLPESDAEGGRGLYIVSTLSSDHGVDQIEHDGKCVWVTVDDESGIAPSEPREG